jgi:hypothetical protein
MSLAPVGRISVPALPDLVDELAARSGGWVVIERFGSVLCHGAGRTECPAALAQALIGKSTVPLRASVSWTRGRGLMRGTLDGLALVAAELGDGATAWFVGSEPAAVQEALPMIAESLLDDGAAPHDPVVEELLHPRGPARRGAAPAALLLVLRADVPVKLLARTAAAAVLGTDARIHVEDDGVLLALALESDAAAVADRVRQVLPDVVAGSCAVGAGASDWVSAARLAAGSLQAAELLDLPFGDSSDPVIAAELVLQEAQAAVVDLVRLLPDAPLRRLHDHDTRGSGELVASLTAWCRAGFDVPVAAAALHVHVNTLRYRLKRAGEVSGLELSQPRQLLALQLLLAV